MEGPVTLHHEVPEYILEDITNRYCKSIDCLIITLIKRLLGEPPQKNVFWECSPKSVYPPTHPRVFVRFGRTKGEIRVKKRRFSG